MDPLSLESWFFGTTDTLNKLKTTTTTTPTTHTTTTTRDAYQGHTVPDSPRPRKVGPDTSSSSIPMSSKWRNLFRATPKLPSWPHASDTRTDQNQQDTTRGRRRERELRSAWQCFHDHVPWTLYEIVHDVQKIPYLLQWLAMDTTKAHPATTPRRNDQHVLLFLLELEHLQTVNKATQRQQARHLWWKYLDAASAFQLVTTLELTTELQQLVKDKMETTTTTADSNVIESFGPIQKLAYRRLTRETMPRFLQSEQYVQMLLGTENSTRAIPLEKVLQQPRAAHYFLLFLMQSRQHFELYFWLHVEYVLQPLLEAANDELFWRLARVLVDKAQKDSKAIELATKNDLYLAVASRRLDETLRPTQPVAKTLLKKAQQEIFTMLRSSWFDQFIKSDLYKVALQDSLIHFDLVEQSKDDASPKLLSRALSSADYATVRTKAKGAEPSMNSGKNDENRIGHEEEKEVVDSELHTADVSDRVSANSSEGERPSDLEEGDGHSFAKIVLNLESIIRLTKLPDGLQVHYRPNYESPNASASMPKEDGCGIDVILTFATFVEKQEVEEAAATLMLMPVPNPHKDTGSIDKSFDDISRRIKPFLVPSGRILIKRSGGEKCPTGMLFPFQQSGRNGFLFGSVYLTYEPMHVGASNEEIYVAKGFCLLSHLPLVNSLRSLVEEHVQSAPDKSSILAHDRLALLFQSRLSWKRTTITSARTHTYVHPEMRRLAHRKHSSILSLPLATLETQVDVPMTILFEHFGTSMVLQILASAVLECSIVVVASQYSLLTMCAEAIRNLLRPFSWCHVYAPVLPKPLLSYLQCPTPILVGVHSTFVLRSDLPTRGLYLVADVDRKVVEYVGDQSISWRGVGLLNDIGVDAIFLPRCFEVAKLELDRLLFPKTLLYDSIGGCGTTSLGTENSSFAHAFPSETAAEQDEQVRGICFDLFSELLSGHTNACLVVGDTKESVVIFDETEFLATCAEEDLLFYRALMRTQCFSEIVSAHRINMNPKETGSEDLEVDEDLQEGII